MFVKIYDKYKSFGREPIRNRFKKVDFDEFLTLEEKELCDYVLENLAIYNGSVLREFTHREMPWMEAREGLGESERCTNIIQESTIQEYFNNVNNKYRLMEKE